MESPFGDPTSFRQFTTMAISLDRDKLETTIRMSDSDLGRKIMGVILESISPEEKTSASMAYEKGIEMLKLTLFYLNELQLTLPRRTERIK